MNDTPRTDAWIASLEAALGDGPPHISQSAIDVVVRLRLTDYARQLERELAEHRAGTESGMTPMPMSDTPITDANTYRGWIKVDDGADSPWHTDRQEWTKAEVARQLERELSAEKEEVLRLRAKEAA